MPKLATRQVIKVHVYDDGDVELTKHPMSESLRINYPTDIFYDAAEIGKGSLDVELINYGCDPERAKEAVDEALNAELYVSVKV